MSRRIRALHDYAPTGEGQVAMKASVTVCTQDDMSLLCIHTTHPPAFIGVFRSLEEKRLLEIYASYRTSGERIARSRSVALRQQLMGWHMQCALMRCLLKCINSPKLVSHLAKKEKKNQFRVIVPQSCRKCWHGAQSLQFTRT